MIIRLLYVLLQYVPNMYARYGHTNTVFCGSVKNSTICYPAQTLVSASFTGYLQRISNVSSIL